MEESKHFGKVFVVSAFHCPIILLSLVPHTGSINHASGIMILIFIAIHKFLGEDQSYVTHIHTNTHTHSGRIETYCSSRKYSARFYYGRKSFPLADS